MTDARVVVADPPWRYQHGLWQRKGSRADANYETLTLEAICAVPVGRMAAADAYLFLWITNQHLLTGWAPVVMRAWGFRPITVIAWDKQQMGIGYYVRNCHENVAFGVRGRPGQFLRKDFRSVFTARAGRHSEKPEEFYDAIETLSDGPYLELFARRDRVGWTCLGNELGDELVGVDWNGGEQT